MTPLRIGVWYIFFVSCIAVGFGIFVIAFVRFSKTYFPERALLNLDRQIDELRKSEPQVVIVGPSYARAIGEKFGHNLTLDAGRLPECSFIINNYCRPDDLVVYVITINEILTMNQPVRREVKSRRARLLTVTRAAIRTFLKPPQEGFAFAKANIDKSEFAECADFTREPELYLDMAGYQLSALSKLSPQDIDLGPFVELHRNHPNTLYVIHPSLPRKIVRSSTVAAEKMNAIYASRQRFRSLFEQSKLPYIDLSDDVEPENFHDFVHLNEHGVNVVADIIKDHLQRNYGISP